MDKNLILKILFGFFFQEIQEDTAGSATAEEHKVISKDYFGNEIVPGFPSFGTSTSFRTQGGFGVGATQLRFFRSGEFVLQFQLRNPGIDSHVFTGGRDDQGVREGP